MMAKRLLQVFQRIAIWFAVLLEKMYRIYVELFKGLFLLTFGGLIITGAIYVYYAIYVYLIVPVLKAILDLLFILRDAPYPLKAMIPIGFLILLILAIFSIPFAGFLTWAFYLHPILQSLEQITKSRD